MSVRYDSETKERGVRLFGECRGEVPGESRSASYRRVHALMESTIGLYKTELIHAGRRTWASRQEAETATTAWVRWFNERRLHSALDYLSPARFEAAYTQDLAPSWKAGRVREESLQEPVRFWDLTGAIRTRPKEPSADGQPGWCVWGDADWLSVPGVLHDLMTLNGRRMPQGTVRFWGPAGLVATGSLKAFHWAIGLTTIAG